MKSKLIQRISALTLTAIMALSLSACGGKTDDETNDATGGKDGTQVVQAAIEKLNSAKSYHAEFSTKMAMSMMGQSMDMSTDMSVDAFTDPIKSKITMSTSDTSGASLPETQVYLQSDGDNYTIYVQSGSQWVTQKLSADEAAQFDFQDSMDIYLSFIKSFTSAGTETVGSAETERYDGAITGKDIMEALTSAASANDNLSSISDLISSLPDQSVIEKMSGLEMSVWVDPATGYPVRQQLDMGSFMTDLMSAIADASDVSTEEMGFKMDAAVITVDFSNLDAVEDFEIPAEAIG